jgi:hypothetical protein
MSRNRIKEVTVEVETEEVLIVRRGRGAIIAYCPACGGAGPALFAQQSASPLVATSAYLPVPLRCSHLSRLNPYHVNSYYRGYYSY